QDAAGRLDAGFFENLRLAAIALDESDAVEPRVFRLGAQVDDGDGGAGGAEVVEDAPTDAAEAADQNGTIHGGLPAIMERDSERLPMDLDDNVCLCFRVTQRKLLQHLRVAQPRVASQLSE